MTTRILPPEEWHRLDRTGMCDALRYVEPADVQVVVVERDGEIVGAWSVLRIVHLEGVWIAPAYRSKGSVAGRLLRATFEAARRWAPRWVMTGSTSPDVSGLLTKHLRAVHIPMDTYIVPMEQ
jgi:hypothetical protein